MSDIQDLFHTNDTQEPSTEGWADKVRTRRRRRHIGAGVAAGVLAVGLAVPLGATLLRQPVQVASPAETQPPAVSPVSAADVCADAAEMVAKRDPAQYADEGVKEGAARVWLCGDGTFGGPFEPLTVGVDEAVQAFLGSPMAPQDQACTMEYRMAYTAVFEYPDGTKVPVTGELHGCRNLADGASTRSGGEEFLTTLKDLWTAQRAADDYSIKIAPPCSDQTTSILPFDPQNVIGVQVCSLDGETWKTDELPAGSDNGDLADKTMASITDATEESDDPMFEFATPQRRIQIFDRFGGRTTLERLADGRFMAYSEDGTMKFWTPPADLVTSLGLDG